MIFLLIYMLAKVAFLHIVNNRTKTDLWNFLISIGVFSELWDKGGGRGDLNVT